MNPNKLCGQHDIYFFYNNSEKVTYSMSFKLKFSTAPFYKQGTTVLPGGGMCGRLHVCWWISLWLQKFLDGFKTE